MESNTQIRLEWLESEINHSSKQVRSIQTQIDRLEGLKATFTNYYDGLEAERQDLATVQHETV